MFNDQIFDLDNDLCLVFNSSQSEGIKSGLFCNKYLSAEVDKMKLILSKCINYLVLTSFSHIINCVSFQFKLPHHIGRSWRLPQRV